MSNIEASRSSAEVQAAIRIRVITYLSSGKGTQQSAADIFMLSLLAVKKCGNAISCKAMLFCNLISEGLNKVLVALLLNRFSSLPLKSAKELLNSMACPIHFGRLKQYENW